MRLRSEHGVFPSVNGLNPLRSILPPFHFKSKQILAHLFSARWQRACGAGFQSCRDCRNIRSATLLAGLEFCPTSLVDWFTKTKKDRCAVVAPVSKFCEQKKC